jgi:hypothetical protein
VRDLVRKIEGFGLPVTTVTPRATGERITDTEAFDSRTSRSCHTGDDALQSVAAAPVSHSGVIERRAALLHLPQSSSAAVPGR